MLMNIVSELRILAAELLVHQALRVMPHNAPEAKPLTEALDGYLRQSAQLARWEKFPA
ncbi:hypothetical protein [Azospirillum sp.]|uniref:hypothetical protein n=1 Tax=Azospirillum sp. TaxID=34012 RepID=UPI002D5B0D8E|nr:hypothetical protein [Azospirillum sp.]HYD66131.1 hypothetical protein [Azospirillum sp.]